MMPSLLQAHNLFFEFGDALIPLGKQTRHVRRFEALRNMLRAVSIPPPGIRI
jgi:hypothetical protein